VIDSTIKQQVQARAIKDAAFRQALISDPKAVLAREYQVQMAESVTLRVVEDTSTLHTLVLPPLEIAMQELTDADLEVVAGAVEVVMLSQACHKGGGGGIG